MNRTEALQSFQRAKVRLCLPGAEPPAHWELRRRLDSFLSRLPAACLQEILEAPGGYVAFANDDTAYHPGRWAHADYCGQGVAVLNAPVFLEDPRLGLYALAALLDHLLGSLCTLPARFISEGQPYSPLWSEFHRRLLAAHELGYARDPAALASPTAYFRWACAAYLGNAVALQAADPQAHRLLRSTLFSAAYWKGHPLRPRPGNQGILCTV